jgi:hypothetical protein
MPCLNSKHLYIYDIERLIKAEKRGAIKSIACNDILSMHDAITSFMTKFISVVSMEITPAGINTFRHGRSTNSTDNNTNSYISPYIIEHCIQ